MALLTLILKINVFLMAVIGQGV